MKDLLLVLTIIISVAITGLILAQGKGGGLGSAWGGGGEQFQTRRGVEKLSLRLTYVLVAVFFILSIINFFIR